MEDYDYPDYPEGYGGYDSTDASGNDSSEASTASENDADTVFPAVAGYADYRRVSELDLTEHDFPYQSKYPLPRYSKRDDLPQVAVVSDSRRVSVHPLGITEKPAGSSDTFWNRMVSDDLFKKTSKITIPAVGKGTTAEGAAIHPAGQESNTVSGSSGGGKSTEDVEEERDRSEMPFLDHLEEFRWALLKSIFIIVIAMLASWFLSDHFYSTITRLAEDVEIPLISTKVMEPIMLKLQMALVMGLVISLPFIFYFLWSFISPGLYKNEKRWILPLVFAATICFFIGALIAYFIIIPFMLGFIKDFLPPDITQMITIGDFIGKILRFTLLFGVIFELPMVAYALAKIGILKHTWMAKYRKFAIISIFILGAVLTPPDPISQIMMAAPLILLYEISIYVARFAGRKTIL